MGSREGLTLRERALEALERSTEMLQVALKLLTQGNVVEAARVRTEARKQRTISTLLMAEANSLEISPKTFRSIPSPNTTNHKTRTTTAH